MRLLRLADVPTHERDRVCRYSPARAVFATLAVIAASVGLVALGRHERSALAYYVAAVLLVAVLVLRRFVIARFRPSNWLVRMGDEGLFVQFRSYLNYRFSGDDLTVVLFHYRDVRSARLVRERRDIPQPDGPADLDRITQVSRRLVELELAVDPAPLVQALVHESAQRASVGATYRHYPVRMTSATTLQLEWSVVPRAQVFLDDLRQYTTIAAPVETSRDDAHLEGLGRGEQERRLKELAETGQTIAAIRIARELYSYDLAQARALVEGLRAKRASP